MRPFIKKKETPTPKKEEEENNKQEIRKVDKVESNFSDPSLGAQRYFMLGQI